MYYKEVAIESEYPSVIRIGNCCMARASLDGWRTRPYN